MIRRKRKPGYAESFIPGDLVSVQESETGFAVMKVLATDQLGVHVRLYVERYAERPEQVPAAPRTLAPFGPGFDHPFSIGHMPLSLHSFADWRPVRIGHEAVAADELEGYRMWEEASGGYF